MDVNTFDSGIPTVPAPAQAQPTPSYQDRSTGLVIFGILEIAGGALAALMIPFLLLGVLIGRKLPGGIAPLGSLAINALTYAGMAVILITLGIGAIQAKRWAWALNLILSWIWLITGALMTVALIVLLPQGVLAGMRNTTQNPGGQQVSAGIMAAIVTFIIVFLAVFFVVLPLTFLLFYRSKNVELTSKYRDPVERWTERLPLPVLAVALLAAFACIYSLAMSLSIPLFPFFGRYLTGLPASAILLVFAAVDAYITFSFFRVKLAGWWVAVTAVGIHIASTIMTVGRADPLAAYSRIGWSRQQVEMMQVNPMFRSGALLWLSIAFAVLYFGFLLWLKRYFRPGTPPS